MGLARLHAPKPLAPVVHGRSDRTRCSNPHRQLRTLDPNSGPWLLADKSVRGNFAELEQETTAYPLDRNHNDDMT